MLFVSRFSPPDCVVWFDVMCFIVCRNLRRLCVCWCARSFLRAQTSSTHTSVWRWSLLFNENAAIKAQQPLLTPPVSVPHFPACTLWLRERHVTRRLSTWVGTAGQGSSWRDASRDPHFFIFILFCLIQTSRFCARASREAGARAAWSLEGRKCDSGRELLFYWAQEFALRLAR